MKPLVFICGALRSGSTMVHLMLDNHPDIDNPGEFDFLFDQVGDDGSYPELERFHEWLEIDRIFKSHQLTIDKSLPARELIRSFVGQIRKDNKVLALNIHRNFHRIPYVFPEAEYIHLIRDPRDVARSSIGMGWAGNVYYGVDHWVESEESWLKLISKLKTKPYTLQYENLVRNFNDELKKVCKYLKLPFSEEMLDYSTKSTYSAPDTSLIEQWKTKLSPDEISQVEFKAKELMLKNGYRPVNDSGIILSAGKRLALKLSNKLYKNKFALNRYGARLYFQEKIGRILNITALYKSAALECAEIEKQYLK